MVDLAPADAAALYGYLHLARLFGEITDAEFDDFGQALGVLDDHHGKEGP